jgi:hypothetical protein
MSRGYLFYLFFEWRNSAFWRQKVNNQCDSYSGFLGKFWLKVARFGQKYSENAIYTQKGSSISPKILKLPDSDKRFQHAAKIF